MKELTIAEKRSWISEELKANYLVETKHWLPEQKFVGKTYRFEDSFKVTELIDADFYENPNLSAQYYPKNTQSTGSKFFDAVQDVVLDVRADKKINEAETKTSASFTVFANPKDLEDYYLDVVFYNKSFIRPMTDAKLRISLKEEPSDFGYVDEVVDSNSWQNERENDFFNLITFKIPAKLFNTLAEGHHTLELVLDFDEVLIKAEQVFSDIDVYALDYLMSNGNWPDKRIEEMYPAFCEKNLVKQIRVLQVDERHFIKEFIKNPLAINEIKQYSEFCENYDKKSNFLDFCKNLRDTIDIKLVDEELEVLDLRLKKAKPRITVCSILLTIVAIVVSIFAYPDYVGWTIAFSVINCIISYFLSLGIVNENKEKADKQIGTAIVLAIAHVILYFVACGVDDSYAAGAAGYSWIYLLAGLIMCGVFNSIYDKKKYGDKTKELVSALKKYIGML